MANRLLKSAWQNGWATRPSLDPDELVRTAAARAAADPDGDMIGWRMRLERLCADLEQHAQLTELGRTIAHGQLISALTGRFRAHSLWNRHPEIADRPISAPIIIVGQMRSGTTRMQRLLACDPRLTFTRFYESWNPIPASRGHSILDSRKLKGWCGLACARFLNPQFDPIHPTAWYAPDEEIGLHNLSIFGSAFEAQWRVPNYIAAVENEDCSGVYLEFRRLLQTLAWLRKDRADRPWVLKVPQFTQDVPTLLHAFPDARLIFLRRDLAATVASSASLVFNQMSLQSHSVDAGWIGQEWSRKVQLREQRMAAARAAAAVPQVEVGFDDVTQDWEQEMRRVYEMINLPLSDKVKATMGRYIRASGEGRRKKHIYDAHQFSLDVSTARMTERDKRQPYPVESRAKVPACADLFD